jgi:hypothetical protein
MTHLNPTEGSAFAGRQAVVTGGGQGRLGLAIS